MKSLKSIALFSVLATPAALGITLSDLTAYSADISTNTYLEQSNVELEATFPSQPALRLPTNKKTTIKSSLGNDRSLFQDTPAHQIHCSKALNLSENSVYTDSITTVGEQHCYVMPLSQKSKVVGQLLAADASSDFNLYLYEYDAAQKVLNYADGSELAAGKLESTYAITEKPSYILVAQLISGAGGNFNFIGNSYTNFDAYEPNDKTFSLASIGKPLTGNLDNPADVDLYAYRLSGSEAELKLYVTGSPEHQFELFNNGHWQVLPKEQQISIKSSSGGTYGVRVIATPGATINPLHNYQIQTSNAVAKFDYWDVSTTDKNLTDLVDYVYTEAFSNLTVRGRMVDSNGVPVPGERMIVSTIVDYKQVNKHKTTNTQGYFTASFDLPKCKGNYLGEFDSNFGTPRDVWNIWGMPAQPVLMYPATNHDIDANWKFIHICKELLKEHISH